MGDDVKDPGKRIIEVNGPAGRVAIHVKDWPRYRKNGYTLAEGFSVDGETAPAVPSSGTGFRSFGGDETNNEDENK